MNFIKVDVNFHDVLDLLRGTGVTIGKFTEHAADYYVCPAFHKALNDKVPIKVTHVHMPRSFHPIYNLCFTLDIAQDYPGFDELLLNFDEIEFCYSMSLAQRTIVLSHPMFTPEKLL